MFAASEAMTPRNLLLILISSQLLCSVFANYHLYTLTVRDGAYDVKKVRTDNPKKYFKTVDDSDSHVQILLKSSYNQTGWDFLEVITKDTLPDEQQAHAAGYLEGRVTHEMIYMHWFNGVKNFCNGRADLCKELDNFINENLAWVESRIREFGDMFDYWHQVKLYYKQIEGLAAGYKHANMDESKALDYRQILWMNTPDLDDYMEMLQAKKRNFTQSNSLKDRKVLGIMPCSALIKVLPDGNEIFAAQDTWSAFRTMLRIQKKYTFAYRTSPNSGLFIPGRAMSFSSYPGVISSGDDFYVISSGLVTMETTIGNSNATLWKHIETENQVSEGARSMVANRLSKNGKAWTKTFSRFNSGAYNNQWMVLDYNKFKKGTLPKDLPDDLLWVVEQIPGHVLAEDMSFLLRKQGYWPSYNVAYFEFIYNISGNLPLVEKYGDWFTYDKTPRALIFKRDHVKVKDLNSMLALMRYNDFKHDPLSKCNCTPPYSGENAIAARCDLNPPNGSYPFPALGHRSHGATDAKITSSQLLLSGLRFLSVSGPPHDEAKGIPPFRWSTSDFGDKTPHMGHPDLWKFEPLIHKWA